MQVYGRIRKQCEHKHQTSPETATARNIVVIKGQGHSVPGHEKEQLNKKGPSSILRMHFLAGMYKLRRTGPYCIIPIPKPENNRNSVRENLPPYSVK